MNILDAIRLTQKTEIQSQGAAVLAMARPVQSLGILLSIQEVMTNTKQVRQRQILDGLNQKLGRAAMAIVRKDDSAGLAVDEEEQSFLSNLNNGLRFGVRAAVRMVFRGVMFVMTRTLRYLVMPVFRLLGSAVLRLLPLLFSPAGLAVAGAGIAGWGAYELYKKLKTPELAPPQPLEPVPSAAPQAQPAVVETSVQPEAPEVQLGPKSNLPKGIRNNNPGNLRYAGQPGADPSSREFAVFPTQGIGLYNMARQIGLHYYNRKLNTIRKLITAWAPPSENKTAVYIAAVSNRTGLSPDQEFDFSDIRVLKSIMAAITIQENGMNPYTDAQLNAAASQAILALQDRGIGTPTSGVISSLFGHRSSPVRGASTDHQGLDIANADGTPVVAAQAGTVIRANQSSDFGNVVEVKGSYYTRYAHMRRLLVQAGQAVRRGQQIGEMGNTGTSSGTHLHFEVHEVRADGAMGKAVDPSQFIGGAKNTKIMTGAPTSNVVNSTQFVRATNGNLLRVTG